MAYIILYVDGKKVKVLDEKVKNIVDEMISNKVCKIDLVLAFKSLAVFVTTEKEVK